MITLVLLPGMDGTGELFAPFVAALGDAIDVRVLRYPNDQVLGYAELQAQVARSLPTDTPFVVLGESFSGPIAVCLAASRPPGLVGVVLCCSFVRHPRPALKALRPLLAVLPLRVGLALLPASVLAHWLLGRWSTPALSTLLAAAVSQVSASAFRARLDAIMGVDVSGALKTIQVPLLCLQATGDRLVPPAAATHVVDMLPASRVVRIDGPHGLLQAAPEASAEAVIDFMQRLLPTSRDRPGSASDGTSARPDLAGR